MAKKSRKRKGGGFGHWLAHKVGRTESIKYQKKLAELESHDKTKEAASLKADYESRHYEEIKKNGEKVEGQVEIMPQAELGELLTFAESQNPFGAGGFKKAYKYEDGTVLTLEKLFPGKNQKSFGQYRKELNTLYTLSKETRKNLLLPTKLGEDNKNHRFLKMPLCMDEGSEASDLFDFIQSQEILNKDKKSVCVNLSELLNTVYELHKLNISCLDIKLENTFVNCGPEKNLLVLGDTDGFTVFKSKNDMYSNGVWCVATPGFYVDGQLSKKGGVKLAGPNSDWFAILQVVLMVYYRIKLKNDDWVRIGFDQTGDISLYGDPTERHQGLSLRSTEDHSNFKTACKLNRESVDEVSELICNALLACGKEYLYKGYEDEPQKYYWDTDKGPENFYKDFILPIVEKLKALEGGRKTRRRRRRTKKKRRRKSRKRRRKRTKKRRRR